MPHTTNHTAGRMALKRRKIGNPTTSTQVQHRGRTKHFNALKAQNTSSVGHVCAFDFFSLCNPHHQMVATNTIYYTVVRRNLIMRLAIMWPPHHHSSRTMWEAIFILTCNFPQYIQYTMMGLLREIRFNTSALITKCYSTMTSVIHIVTPTTTSAIEISGIFYLKNLTSYCIFSLNEIRHFYFHE